MPDTTHPFGKWLPTETWFRIATRAAAIGVWEWDVATGKMRYSSVARQICGFDPHEEITYEMVRAATHSEDYPWTSERARRALDPAIRDTPEYEYRIKRHDTGEVRWVFARGEAMFETVDGIERAVRYVGTIQDITEQKRVADRLAEGEARLRLAIEAAGLAVWEVEPARETLVGSPELNRLCGFAEDAQPTLADFRALYAPGERERIEAEGAAMLARGETQIQTVFKQIWPDGSPHWLLMRAQVLPGAAEGERRVVGVVMDGTEQKLQEQRIEAVAHEMRHRLKNLIAIVAALATQSWRNGAAGPAALDAFRGRLHALAIATDLILSGGETAADLRTLIEAVIKPFRTDGESRFVLAGEPVEVPAKATQSLAMALHELCTNAVKYGALSGAGGQVRISWGQSGDVLDLVWREHGGPPVAPDDSGGYGTRLLRGLFSRPHELALEFHADGAECRIRLDLAPAAG